MQLNYLFVTLALLINYAFSATHQLRTIQWINLKTGVTSPIKVLTQAPGTSACPLISVINALILKSEITINNDVSIDDDEIAALLINNLEQIKLTEDYYRWSQRRKNALEAVQDSLPGLYNGLDVDFKFNGIVTYKAL